MVDILLSFICTHRMTETRVPQKQDILVEDKKCTFIDCNAACTENVDSTLSTLICVYALSIKVTDKSKAISNSTKVAPTTNLLWSKAFSNRLE